MAMTREAPTGHRGHNASSNKVEQTVHTTGTTVGLMFAHTEALVSLLCFIFWFN